MHDDGRQVVEAAVGVAEPGAGEIPQQVVAHVQPGQRKFNKGVHLGPRVLGPTEPAVAHGLSASFNI